MSRLGSKVPQPQGHGRAVQPRPRCVRLPLVGIRTALELRSTPRAFDAQTPTMATRERAALPETNRPVAATPARALRRRRWLAIAGALTLVIATAVVLQHRVPAEPSGKRRGARRCRSRWPRGARGRPRSPQRARIGRRVQHGDVRPRVDGQLMRVAFQEGQLVTSGRSAGRDRSAAVPGAARTGRGPAREGPGAARERRTQLARYQLLLSAGFDRGSNVDDQASTVAQLEGALKVDRGRHRQRQAESDLHPRHRADRRAGRPAPGRCRQHCQRRQHDGLVVITAGPADCRLFTLPEDTLRIVLPRIEGQAVLPVDVFDRSGATHLASGSVLTARQPDRSKHRHRPHQGRLRQRDRAPVSRAVRQRSDRRGHAAGPDRRAGGGGAARTAGRVRLRGPERQGGRSPGDRRRRGRRPGARSTAGSHAGDQVVTDGTDRLRDGSRVEIRRPGGAPGRPRTTAGTRLDGRDRMSPSRPFILRPVATSLLMVGDPARGRGRLPAAAGLGAAARWTTRRSRSRRSIRARART